MHVLHKAMNRTTGCHAILHGSWVTPHRRVSYLQGEWMQQIQKMTKLEVLHLAKGIEFDEEPLRYKTQYTVLIMVCGIRIA